MPIPGSRSRGRVAASAPARAGRVVDSARRPETTLDRQPRNVEDSLVHMTEIVLPEDAKPHGRDGLERWALGGVGKAAEGQTDVRRHRQRVLVVQVCDEVTEDAPFGALRAIAKRESNR